MYTIAHKRNVCKLYRSSSVNKDENLNIKLINITDNIINKDPDA